MGACCSECERTAHEDTIESVPSAFAVSPLGRSNVPPTVPIMQLGLIFSSPLNTLGHSQGIDPPAFGGAGDVPPSSRSWHEVSGGATTPRGTTTPRDETFASPQPRTSRTTTEQSEGRFPTPRATSRGGSRGGMTTPRDLTTPRGIVGGDFLTPRPGGFVGEAKEQGSVPSAKGDYVGTWQGTKKHGFGRFVANGSTYDGDFCDDLKHGNGVLTWEDGRRYCGQFARGKFHGSAVMTWLDGRQYKGQYWEDKKHGEGIFTWQDGRKYDGQWLAGKRQGTGIYTNAKGITRTGTWQLDRPMHWEPAAPTIARADLPTCAETEVDTVDGGRSAVIELDDQSLHDAITARIMMGAGGA